MTRNVRKTLVFLVKLVVAGGLLWLVFRRVHWSDYTVTIDGVEQLSRGLRSTITSANPYLLAGAFVGFAATIFIMAFRWWYLLRVLHIRLGVWEAVRLTFLGAVFNYVVPGMVSGDLVKAYYVFKHTERKAAALVSIFVDRAVGVVQFAILPAVLMVVMAAVGAGTDRLALPATVVAIVLAVMGLGTAVLFSPGFRRALRLDRLAARLPMQRHLTVAAQAVSLYRRRSGALAVALGVTFCGQGIFITAIMAAGLTLAPRIPWYHYYLYVPLIYIIAAVPISPGSVGLTEACFVMFLRSPAVTDSEVLAVALVARLFPMICSLPGLIVALTGAKLPRAGRMAAEMTETGD